MTAAAPDAIRPVLSNVLGTLEVREADVLEFAHGVLGFPDSRAFVLLPTGFGGIYWLQSVENSALTFVVADPFQFFPDFTVDIGPRLAELLKATEPSAVAVFCIVTLASGDDLLPTMNLQGPLLVNLAQRLGMQYVIADAPWGVAEPFAMPVRA